MVSVEDYTNGPNMNSDEFPLTSETQKIAAGLSL